MLKLRIDVRVKDIFNSSFAVYYEKVINGISSPIQVDRWRKVLVKGAETVYPNASTVVDFCSGAGNVGKFYLERNPNATLINCDISNPLLQLAKEKFCDRKNVTFVRCDNRFFPIKDNSIDILFSSFCVRNSPEPLLTVEEVRRTLKMGGVWAILDFFKLEDESIWTAINNAVFKCFMNFNKIVVPSNSEAINYLFESIKKFYTLQDFKKVLSKFGFKVVSVKNLMAGIANSLIATKKEE